MIKHQPTSHNINMSLAISIATTILSISLMANAGVIIDKKPALKNYLEENPVAISKPKSLSKAETEKPPRIDSKKDVKNTEFSVSPQSIALPATILGITGMAFIAYRYDSDFASFVNKSSLRPSDI